MEVIIIDGQTIKACECDAPITVDASATMTGSGAVTT